MQTLKVSLVALSACVFSALPALAQTQAGPVSPGAAPAAEPAAAPPPATTPAAPAQAAPAAAGEAAPPPPPCFPACREGFVCGDAGQCISACNPPCGAGERCTAQAQCVVDSQVTPTEPVYTPPPNAQKPAPPPEHGIETHDGVMLRFTVGIGGGVMKESFDDDIVGDTKYGAGGLMWAVDLGGGVTDELTVHARLGQLLLLSPKVTQDGDEVDDFDEGRNVSAVLLGAGLTYNIMPINMYVTAVGGLSVVSITDGEHPEDYEQDEPKGGFGLNLDLGKEWWVTHQTGIGVAGRLWWATGGADNRPAPSDRALLAFGVVFSVTHQ